MNGRWLGLGAVCLVAACSKSGAPHADGTPASVASVASSAGVMSTSDGVAIGAARSAEAATTVAPAAQADGPPSSFAGGKKEAIDNAVGLGCEARSAGGFLEFLCRRKDGTGGHPVQASTNAEPGSASEADASETVQADEHGELRLVLPFHDGASKDTTLEFSDTRYVLHVTGTSAKLEWVAGGLPLRRACAKVGDDSKAVLKSAQQGASPERVLAADIAKFPRLGVCYPAGFGSWALALHALSASGEGAERRVHADIDVVRVSDQGQTLAASFASFEFSPGGLEISPLQTYDYDDDGKDDLVVAYEVTAVPPGIVPAHPPNVWSYSDGGVTSYPKAPQVTAGGASIEQLEFDMRPDIGSYGPYAAWFGADCGFKQCPARLTGPRFFFRSLPGGEFALGDVAAKAALKRACPKKPEAVVASANLAQTAKNLVCARVWGAAAEAVSAELSEKHGALCGEAATCPLATTLDAWAKAPPPITLESDSVGAAKP